MISEPLTMFECCPNGDGAAACIIASPRAVRRLGHQGGVWIKASAMASGGLIDQLDTGEPVTTSVSRLGLRARWNRPKGRGPRRTP